VGHAPQDLVLLEVLGDGDLHGAVEGELAGVDLLQDVDHEAQGVVALEDLAAEAAAGDLDPLGQLDLLVAGQEGDLAHLGQVHADRVVDPAGDLVLELLGAEVVVVGGLVDDLVVGVGVVLAAEEAGLGLLLADQLDAELLERLDQGLELLGVAGSSGSRSLTWSKVRNPRRFPSSRSVLMPSSNFSIETISSCETTGQDAARVFGSGRWCKRR